MKDIKKLGIPNVCFSLTDEDDKREKLFAKQRMERGFDDSETWSLRDTIGNFTLPRLKRFREITPTHSDTPEYPGELSRTEWLEILDKMIIAFELLVRDKGSFILNEEEEKQYKEGMDLFHEYFLGLWW